MPPTLEHETTEALLGRLTHLCEIYGRLAADASTRGIDHDDLVGAAQSTIRVIDCVLLERGAHLDDVAQRRRVAALTAAGLSTNLRRWIDDVQIQTEAPRPKEPDADTPLRRGASEHSRGWASPGRNAKDVAALRADTNPHPAGRRLLAVRLTVR